MRSNEQRVTLDERSKNTDRQKGEGDIIPNFQFLISFYNDLWLQATVIALLLGRLGSPGSASPARLLLSPSYSYTTPYYCSDVETSVTILAGLRSEPA